MLLITLLKRFFASELYVQDTTRKADDRMLRWEMDRLEGFTGWGLHFRG